MGGAAVATAPPMRVDDRCAPRAREAITSVGVADQVVLYDRRTGALHELNGTAALVWSRCDGTTTLGELVDDLTAEFGAPRRAIRAGVHDVVRQLAGADLVGEGAAEVAEDVPRRANRTRPPCAPCLAKLNSLGWAGTVAVGVGDEAIGVRASTPEGLDTITELLAPWVIDEPGAPLHYSVVTADRSERGPRQLDRLYLGDQLLVRTRSRRRVLRALVAHLEGHGDGTRRDQLLLSGPVLVRDGGAVVVSDEPGSWAELTDGPLRQLGISRWDGPSAALVGPGQLALGAPSLLVEPILEGLDDPGSGREPEQPAPGVRELRAWLVGPHAEPLTGAHAIAAMLPSVRNADAFGVAASLELLAAQVGSVTFDPLVCSTPAAYAEAVDRLLR